MNDSILAGPAKSLPLDYSGISDVMVYDIARHRATVLSSMLLRRARDAETSEEREHWETCRRLLKKHARALSPEDRAEIIAQIALWRIEEHALDSPPTPPRLPTPTD